MDSVSRTGTAENLSLLCSQTVKASVESKVLKGYFHNLSNTIWWDNSGDSICSSGQLTCQTLEIHPMTTYFTALRRREVAAFLKSNFSSWSQAMHLRWRRTAGFWTSAELLWFAPSAVGRYACEHKRGTIFNQLVCEESMKGTHISQSGPFTVRLGSTSSGQ